MGIIKGIFVFFLSLIVIGIVIGGAGYYYIDNEALPFLKEKYDNLHRFDEPNNNTYNPH